MSSSVKFKARTRAVARTAPESADRLDCLGLLAFFGSFLTASASTLMPRMIWVAAVGLAVAWLLARFSFVELREHCRWTCKSKN